MVVVKIIRDAFRSFISDRCFDLAANISFYALLAIVPIGMLIVSIAGYFLGSSEAAFSRLVAFAAHELPVGREQFLSNLKSLMEQSSSLGLVGVVFLIFIATFLVASIERALNTVFDAVKGRNFFHARFLGIGIIFLVTILFSLPTMAQILEGLLERYGFSFPLSELMGGKVFFFLTAYIAYLMVIVIVPNHKIHLRYAAIGGIIYAIGIGFTKLLFRWYLVFAMQRYSVIYGSLAAVVLMIVWIYYVSLVMLLSAEIVSALQAARIFHSVQVVPHKGVQS